MHHWAVIWLGTSLARREDFGEVVEQFRPRLQSRFQASRQIRDTVGSGKGRATRRGWPESPPHDGRTARLDTHRRDAGIVTLWK